jgi:hypothetical protein
VDVVSEDGHFRHLVAVSTRTGEAYLLAGFKNAEAEFNKLARDAILRIESPHDARMHASLYFKAVVDPSGDRLIFGSRQLRHHIEDYFAFHYYEKEAERRSKKWWSGFNSKNRNFPFDSIATKHSVGYEAQLAVMSGSPKQNCRFGPLDTADFSRRRLPKNEQLRHRSREDWNLVVLPRQRKTDRRFQFLLLCKPLPVLS